MKEDFTLLADAPGVYTDIINADEKNGWAWNMRGLAWHEKGEWENAIKDYTETIRLDPKDAAAFNNRGCVWRDKKEYDKAIKDYDEAIRLDPKYANALNNRGITNVDRREYEKAIKDSSEAIRLDPKFAQAFNNRGNARRGSKEFYKANEDYDEAIRLAPKYSRAFLERGANNLIIRMPTASADFRSAITIADWKAVDCTYATILGQLSAKFQKDEDAAKQFLSKAEGKLDEAWPYPVVKYLRGDLDEPALMKLAIDDDKRTEARC